MIWCQAQADVDVALKISIESSDTVAVGQVKKITKLCGFSENGPSTKDIIKELFWAEVHISSYLKTPGMKPEVIRIMWFRDVLKKGVVVSKSIDIQPNMEVIWFYSQLHQDSETEGIMHPHFAYTKKKELDAVKKLLRRVGP